LLIYIGTAADIVEFSEIYGEDDLDTKLGGDLRSVLIGLMVVWGISVIQFSMTIALPQDEFKNDDNEDDEDEEVFEEQSYFRSKIQNKVAPMSYMHYKSMMRDGFQGDNRNGTVSNNNALLRNAFTARNAFTQKHDHTSKTLNSIHVQNGSVNYKKTMSENGRPPLGRLRTPPISFKNNKKYQTDERIITLPHGERLPRTVGSPQSVRSLKFNGSSQSSRSKKNGNSNSPSILSTKKQDSPQSIRSFRSHNGSINSKRNNKLSNSTAPNTSQIRKVSRLDRILRKIQFTPKGSPKERKDSAKEDNSLGIGKEEMKNCFIIYMDLIGILLPVCMQDGPFFIARCVLVLRYDIITEMIFLLIVKNALVIIVQIYRILLMYCSEPNNEPEMNDASLRVRNAMNSTKKLSDKGFRSQRASIAIQAISRLQHKFNEKPTEAAEFLDEEATISSKLDATVIEMYNKNE